MSELDRRRHRAGKPFILVATVTALAGLTVGAVLLWRRRRYERRRARQVWAAVRRAVAHSERVAPRKQEPPFARKVLGAAAASVASVAARRAAQQLLASPRSGQPRRFGRS